MAAQTEFYPTPPAASFAGRESFRDRVRWAFTAAAAEHWPVLTLCDTDFSDWPLGEPDVLQCLTDWAELGSTLTLLAVHYDAVRRLFPLFVRWRQRYSHKIDARAVALEHAGDLPSALWSPDWTLLRYNTRQSRGACGADPYRNHVVRGLLDDWLARSTPAFAADTLGL